MTTQWKAYHLNKMLQDALKNRPLMGRLVGADEQVFDDYQLTEAEKEVFRKPTGVALRKLGVHPILAMIYMIPHDAPLRNLLMISPEHLARLKELY
jgi:hypothetical protein